MESLLETLTGTVSAVGEAVATAKKAKDKKAKAEAEASEKAQAEAKAKADEEAKQQAKAQAEAEASEKAKAKAKAEAEELAKSTYLQGKGYKKEDISTILASERTGLGKDFLVGEKREGFRRQRMSNIIRDLARQSKDDALLQRYFGQRELEATLQGLGKTKAERQANLNRLYGGNK